MVPEALPKADESRPPEGAASPRSQGAGSSISHPHDALRTKVVPSNGTGSFHIPERLGMVYDIEVDEQGGSACTVPSAVLLTVLDGSIVHEETLRDADSSIACGWAE